MVDYSFAAESLYKFNVEEINALEERIKSKGCGEIFDKCVEQSEELCIESGVDQNEECSQELIVHVKKGRQVQKKITIYYSGKGEGDHELVVDLNKGTLLGKKSSIKVSALVSEIPQCESVMLTVDSYQLWDDPRLTGGFDHDAMPELKGPVQCDNSIRVPMRISGRSDRLNKGLVINLSIKFRTQNVVRDEWRGDCDIKAVRLDKLGCHIKEANNCTKRKSTRDISGEKITRSCWQRQTIFECPQFESGKRCSELRRKGCEQVNSKCIAYDGHRQCEKYQQTFTCSKNHCAQTVYKDCDDDMDFMNKNYSRDESPDNKEEFKRALTSFSAVTESASSFDGLQVFRGESLNLLLNLQIKRG